MDKDNDNTPVRSVQSALSLSNSVLIIGGTLFTIAAFFVTLSYRVTTVEGTLKDFPLYRVENRLTSIESSISQLREEMRENGRDVRENGRDLQENDNRRTK